MLGKSSPAMPTWNHLYHCFPSPSPTKPRHLLGTVGREEVSTLLPNTLIASNTPLVQTLSPTQQPPKLLNYSSATMGVLHVPAQPLSLPHQGVCRNSDFVHIALAQMVFSPSFFLFLKRVYLKKNPNLSSCDECVVRHT